MRVLAALLCAYLNFSSMLYGVGGKISALEALEKIAPKTTQQLRISIQSRNLPAEEAEKMAAYLVEVIRDFQIQNVGAFDLNTSHIIGREWHEIDYSGEGMTWQAQQKKYKPYGVVHFKSLKCLKSFFPVESKLPYFKKIYKPKGK